MYKTRAPCTVPRIYSRFSADGRVLRLLRVGQCQLCASLCVDIFVMHTACSAIPLFQCICCVRSVNRYSASVVSALQDVTSRPSSKAALKSLIFWNGSVLLFDFSCSISLVFLLHLYGFSYLPGDFSLLVDSFSSDFGFLKLHFRNCLSLQIFMVPTSSL